MMTIMVERIEDLIRDEIAKQAQNDDVLLFDPPSGLVDGTLNLQRVAEAVIQAVAPEQESDAKLELAT